MGYIGEGKMKIDEALDRSIEKYRNLYLKCEEMREMISNALKEVLRQI